ncbi:MAG: hypothetical protein Q7S66_05670 [bacterium]|nr:hypothetical protein [bacterium]
MKNEIIEKLKNITTLKEYSEPYVAYFLIEAYKLLEQENKLDNYELIKFYRNWSCHSKLDKATHKIFEEIYIIIRADEYLGLRQNNPIAFSDLIDDTVDKIFEKYSFKMLKKEIDRFSADYLGGKDLDFQSFQRPLQNIIKDIPLIVTKHHNGGEEIFRFEVREQLGPKANPPFNDLTFYIKYPGGQMSGGSRAKLTTF